MKREKIQYVAIFSFLNVALFLFMFVYTLLLVFKMNRILLCVQDK